MTRLTSTLGSFLACSLLAASALAQTSATPPADLAASVTAAKPVGVPPGPPPPLTDTTNAAISAGGQFATGNSRLAAVTGTGKFDMRRGANAFGAALIGNYAVSDIAGAPTVTKSGTSTIVAAGAPASWKESTENLQGKLRYDRYVSRDLSAFLQLTGTHDAFQALTFRLNVDPGVKYLVMDDPEIKIWGEAGYDFQYDRNYTDGQGIEQAGAGGPATDGVGAAYLISQDDTIHSTRLFAGYQQSFNKDVQLNVGLEYLQGLGGGGGSPSSPLPTGFITPTGAATQKVLSTQTFVDPQSISLTGSRLNLNILLAAKLRAGLSVGVGFQAKYNSAPLPGKEDLDTSSTLTLIYSFSGSAPPAPTPVVVLPVPCLPEAGPGALEGHAPPPPPPGQPQPPPPPPPAGSPAAAPVPPPAPPMPAPAPANGPLTAPPAPPVPMTAPAPMPPG